MIHQPLVLSTQYSVAIDNHDNYHHRIPAGEAGNWLSFICSEKEPFPNGWYAVKQPSSMAIGDEITWVEAREEGRTDSSQQSLGGGISMQFTRSTFRT